MVKSTLFVFCGWMMSLAVEAQQTVRNSIGMEFVLVSPGSFTVGEFRPPYPVPDDTVKGALRPYSIWLGDLQYTDEDFHHAMKLALSDARPGFQVVIQKPYYIGRFEVTQAQWQEVMGKNPSVFKANGTDADSLPVENVTWKEAVRFVRKLNKLENTKRYRLPTEFEWEFAARAGNRSDVTWQEISATAQIGKKTTQPIGRKQPNAWGIYDMLGNVWEWVADAYNRELFADPEPKQKGKLHVLKGASIAGDPKNATYMTHASGPGNGWDVGLRIVMETEINGR
jgi:formylglycine-generating enzyme